MISSFMVNGFDWIKRMNSHYIAIIRASIWVTFCALPSSSLMSDAFSSLIVFLLKSWVLIGNIAVTEFVFHESLFFEVFFRDSFFASRELSYD